MAVRTTPAGNQSVGGAATASFANGVAGGWIGYIARTADQTGITTPVDVSGVTVTVTVNPSRRIRVSATCPGISGSATDTIAQLTIVEGSTVLATGRSPSAFAGLSYNAPVNPWTVLTPGAGSHTYKLQIEKLTGSGTVSIGADAQRPTILLVEDIGPA